MANPEPATCRRHPESRAVITTHNPGGNAPYRLTQQWCGEPQCGNPLGWHYRSRDGHEVSGNDHFAHPEAEQDLRREAYDENTALTTVLFTLGMASMATGITLMAINQLDGLMAAAAAPLPTLAAAGICIRRFRRRRQNRPERPRWTSTAHIESDAASDDAQKRGETP